MAKRDYRQFCPTARALNLVGERWTLLIVRDLMMQPRRYSELRRSLAGMASNLLAVRLAEMEDAGLVVKERIDDPTPRDVYALTAQGRRLEPVLLELARFGLPLLGMPTEEEPMVAERVPLGLRAMMHEPDLPDRALTIRFALDEGDHLVTIAARGPSGSRRWPHERIHVAAVPGDGDREVPKVDVTVRGTMAALLWIRQGLLDLETATRDGMLALEGSEPAQQALRHLYRLDPVLD